MMLPELVLSGRGNVVRNMTTLDHSFRDLRDYVAT